jgi:hypothetical protein
MYVIVKMIKNENGIKMPVLILDSSDEVLEFDTEDDAKKIKEIFQKNSDSGYEYIIKKI